jgi:hypothetical protein
MGRKTNPKSIRQRAIALGLHPKTLALRESPEKRAKHLKVVNRYYRENREKCLQMMTAYSVKRSGRIICKVCRHKYANLKAHLTRLSEKGDPAHYKELGRLWGNKYPDAFISAKEQAIKN